MTEVTNTLQRRGLMLILSSPSGAGKTTIANRLLKRDRNLKLSISVTTRPRRPGEVDGQDYHFIDRARFDQLVGENALLEHAVVFDNCYGTPRQPVIESLDAGRDMLFDIDWQGRRQLAEKEPADLVSIFILPPSAAELARRLKSRAQDSAQVIARRMAKASDEMNQYFDYDYVVVNTDLDRSVDRVHAILEAERTKRVRQLGVGDFVRKLQSDLQTLD
jgi:guanylate kinase